MSSKMRRSTQWFIFGAMWLCLALVTYFSRAMAEQRAFWYGTYDMPTLELVILHYGLYVISIASTLGIICFFVGLSKAGAITVTVKEEPVTEKELHQTPTVEKATTNTSKEVIMKEFVMIPCESCESLIPQSSTFCPDCGVKRE